jgi:hypothetical protein
MKYLREFRIFESMSPDEFIDTFLDRDKVRFYKDGRIIYDGSVDLSNRKLHNIPVKFKRVSEFINVNGNNLKTFEFLPDVIDSPRSSGYLFYNNSFEGKLKEIFSLIKNKKRDPIGYYIDKLIFDFTAECLLLGAWVDGETDERAIEEAWISAKSDMFIKDKETFIKYFYDFLDLNDYEILLEIFDLQKENWLEELISKLVDKIKSDDLSESKRGIKILFSLIRNDDSDDIKELVENKYDLSDIYNKRKENINDWTDKKLDNFTKIMKSKLSRDKDKIRRDKNNDLFVFIGSEEFVKTKENNYKKVFQIENFMKFNMYDESDLNDISMMKIRARANMKGVYMIWLPKGTFRVEKDSYTEEEIPEWLIQLINKNKTRI